MVYYYLFKGEKVGWKAQHLHDEASERLLAALQELSKSREDGGVRVGLMETAPADITRWLEPNFVRIEAAEPKTLEQLLELLHEPNPPKT